jgi:hypothetical protein
MRLKSHRHRREDSTNPAKTPSVSHQSQSRSLAQINILHLREVAANLGKNVLPNQPDVPTERMSMIRAQYVLYFLIFGSILGFLNVGNGAEPSSTSPLLLNPSEAQLREALTKQVVEDPRLHGAWAELRRNQNGQYEVTAIVDSDPARADIQLKEIERIVGTHLAKEQYQLGPVLHLPFCKVLEQIRDASDDEPELAGSRIDDGYYKEIGSELFLVLAGRVVSDEQKVALINKANDIVKIFYGPKTKRITKVKSEGIARKDPGLAIVKPSEEVSADFYGRGIDLFRQGAYADAYRAFSTAYLELPHTAQRRRAVVIQYWRAVSLIGNDDKVRASKLLKPIIDGRHNPRFQGDEDNVAAALEPVQGSIRHELEEIESKLAYGARNCARPAKPE